MPYGVYVAGTAGDEVSSTYEGRHLTFSESQLTHPDNSAEEVADLVNKGDPVLVGNDIVGVALKSGVTVNTELIAIDTEGIFQLSVVATDEDGASAVAVGDVIYIAKSGCLLSKNANKNTHQRFGYALYPIASGTDVIPVKVHWNPDDALEKVGTHAVPEESAHADKIFREYRYRSTSETGDVRGLYMELLMNGAGLSGEAGRFRAMVEKAVAVAHGCHDGIEFATGGSITGLGVGHRATGKFPNKALWATIAGGMSELWADGALTDFGTATVHSIHRFGMGGNETGYATADNVFEFFNLSAIQYAANTDTPTMALRCIINGNIRYIMVSEAQAA